MLLKLMKLEYRLWSSLYAWMRRRPHGPDEYPYHARSQMGLVMGVLILVTPLEIAVIELLIPWPWLRIVTLVLALYALLWIIMLFASFRSLPHRLESDALVLRHGVLAEGRIPYDRIAEAHVYMGKAPGSGDGLQLDGEIAYLAIDGETQLAVRLKEPLPIEKVLGRTPPVHEIRFATDDPKRLIERLRFRLDPATQQLPVDKAGGGGLS